ncbi:hypothetical protein BJY14_004491 [Actinomadura luteofluorescens]|uniref:Uncharacterized protein n=1 Tax=Actinomadura luteofluorescens TaxID=46163 RepID=A0A7Y9EIT0_9ACTN|nr:hypothetical protein [Actinomadura luteofluorescens]
MTKRNACHSLHPSPSLLTLSATRHVASGYAVLPRGASPRPRNDPPPLQPHRHRDVDGHRDVDDLTPHPASHHPRTRPDRDLPGPRTGDPTTIGHPRRPRQRRHVRRRLPPMPRPPNPADQDRRDPHHPDNNREAHHKNRPRPPIPAQPPPPTPQARTTPRPEPHPLPQTPPLGLPLTKTPPPSPPAPRPKSAAARRPPLLRKTPTDRHAGRAGARHGWRATGATRGSPDRQGHRDRLAAPGPARRHHQRPPGAVRGHPGGRAGGRGMACGGGVTRWWAVWVTGWWWVGRRVLSRRPCGRGR